MWSLIIFILSMSLVVAQEAGMTEILFTNTSTSWQAFLACTDTQTLASPSKLYKCIKAAAKSHSMTLQHVTAYQIGPKPLSVGLVTFVTPDILPYAAYALAINLVYAIHNQYALVIYDSSDLTLDGYDVRWNKVALLRDALAADAWAASMDYVMWMDADLIMLDLNYQLEEIVRRHPDARFMASAGTPPPPSFLPAAPVPVAYADRFLTEHAGSSTLINSGAVLVANHPMAVDLLSAWWGDADHRKLYSDQESFDMLLQDVRAERVQTAHLHPESLDGVVVLRVDELNSDPPAMTQQRPEHRVLHLMGEEEAFRKKVFQSGLEDILEHALPFFTGGDLSSSSRTLAPGAYEHYDIERPVLWSAQLGLTQSKLLQLTIAEYFAIAQNSIATFESALATAPQGLSKARMLSNSVHHYVHALEHLLARPEVYKEHARLLSEQLFDGVTVPKPMESIRSTTQRLRQKVYNLLKANILSIKKAHKKSFAQKYGIANPTGLQVLVDYPEIVKTAATAGQQLLAPVDDGQSLHVFKAHKADKGYVKQQQLIAQELHMLLKEMLYRSHPSQHAAIHHMIAYLYNQQGLLQLTSGDLQSAFYLFEMNYNITFGLAQQSGDYLLIQPLLLMANTLSLLSEHAVADKFFVRGIEIASRYQHIYRQEFLQLLVNHAIALVSDQQASRALDVLERAFRVMDEQQPGGRPADSGLRAIAQEYHQQAQRIQSD